MFHSVLTSLPAAGASSCRVPRFSSSCLPAQEAAQKTGEQRTREEHEEQEEEEDLTLAYAARGQSSTLLYTHIFILPWKYLERGESFNWNQYCTLITVELSGIKAFINLTVGTFVYLQQLNATKRRNLYYFRRNKQI